MSINLNVELIDDFRFKANQNPVFSNLYKNIDSKNRWNVICSAMDWITVTSSGIKHIKLSRRGKFGLDDVESLNLMQYIITVDILVESIIQLYRVLYGNKYQYPLADSKSIFKQSTISDDLYFKHLRAAFGTHQVNLNSIDGRKGNKEERFYASWSSRDITGEYDYIAFLYSNDPEKDDMYELGINIDQINRYAEERYNLLKDLKHRIDAITEEIVHKYKNDIIPFSDDIIDQLNILFDVNKKRCGVRRGYADELSYLIRVMSTYRELIISDKVVDTYIDFLTAQIADIKKSIQNVDYNARLQKPNLQGGYEFEKIYSYIYDYHPIGEQYYKELISVGFLPENLFTINTNTNDLKELILDAYLYKESDNLSKVISIAALLKD